MDLRLGKWQDVLGDVKTSRSRTVHVICDPPYSERTHSGHDAGIAPSDGFGRAPGATKKANGKTSQRREHGYGFWTPADVDEFIDGWSDRCGWLHAMTDHVLFPAYEDAARAAGRYTFAPIPCITTGSRFRALGDGPACWTVWDFACRPRTKEYGMNCVGNVSPVYSGKAVRDLLRVGGKPLWLMRAIIRDYTKPGDIVCDPFAGGGTTLLAAAIEGRGSVGAEMDPETYEKAKDRLASGYTRSMF